MLPITKWSLFSTMMSSVFLFCRPRSIRLGEVKNYGPILIYKYNKYTVIRRISKSTSNNPIAGISKTCRYLFYFFLLSLCEDKVKKHPEIRPT